MPIQLHFPCCVKLLPLFWLDVLRTHRSMPCEHGRQKFRCKDCGGSGICEHGRVKYQCKDCGGSSFCKHGRRKSRCKECGGSGICEHGRQKYQCRECGRGVCVHGRRKSRCKECGGRGICEHGRQKKQCKDCGGSSFCEHGRRKNRCKECAAKAGSEPVVSSGASSAAEPPSLSLVQVQPVRLQVKEEVGAAAAGFAATTGTVQYSHAAQLSSIQEQAASLRSVMSQQMMHVNGGFGFPLPAGNLPAGVQMQAHAATQALLQHLMPRQGVFHGGQHIMPQQDVFQGGQHLMPWQGMFPGGQHIMPRQDSSFQGGGGMVSSATAYPASAGGLSIMAGGIMPNAPASLLCKSEFGMAPDAKRQRLLSQPSTSAAAQVVSQQAPAPFRVDVPVQKISSFYV